MPRETEVPEPQCPGLVHQTDIAVDAHRPEILIPCAIHPVKLHPGVGGDQLQIERSHLDRLLLVPRQMGERLSVNVSAMREFMCAGYDNALPAIHLPMRVTLGKAVSS